MSIFAAVKRLFKHSAVYGVGHILTRSIVFFLMPLHTNIFPKAEMGVVGLVFAYLAIFTIVYSYGLDTAFFRFYILADNKDSQNRVFTTAFLTIIGTSLLFTAIIFTNADWIAARIFGSEVQKLNVNLPLMIRLASGILLFDALSFMPFLILRAEEKSFPFIAFKFLNVTFNFVFNIVFIIKLNYGIEAIFVANLIASFVTFLALLPAGLRRFNFNYSTVTLGELFAFGIPYLPSTLCVALMDTVDRIFLERLADVEAVGLFSQGSKLGMFMALFVTAFRFAWHPFFLSTLKQENAKEIFSKVFTYVLLACSFVFLFFSAFINEIAHFQINGFSILGKDFWSATKVVPVIFLAYIFYAAYLNFLIGIYLHKKTKYLPWITAAGMLGNVIANVTLIPMLGMMGAAWARTVAYVIMSVTLYAVGKQLYPVKYEWSRILKMVIIAAVFYFVTQWAPVSQNSVLKLAIVAMYPLVLFITGFFQRTELLTLKSIVTRNRFRRS